MALPGKSRGEVPKTELRPRAGSSGGVATPVRVRGAGGGTPFGREWVWRRLLLGVSGFLLLVYGFILTVAITTSGAELAVSPWAYYAGGAPVAYLLFCLATALGWVPTRWRLPLGISAHILVAPTLLLSLLRMGPDIPVVALVWTLHHLAGRSPRAQLETDRDVLKDPVRLVPGGKE